jgi:hypothetical protein
VLIGMGTQEQGLIHEMFGLFALLLPYLSIVPVFCCFISLDTVKSKMGLVHKDDVD